MGCVVNCVCMSGYTVIEQFISIKVCSSAKIFCRGGKGGGQFPELEGMGEGKSSPPEVV